jgi:hypothetical protein
MNQGPAALQYVWVRLVQNGTLSASTMLVFKPEFGIWNNDALKEAAKLKFPARLQGLDADLLEVRATIDGPVLRPSQAPPDSAQQDDTPLFIFDPRPVTTSGSTGELFTIWSFSLPPLRFLFAAMRVVACALVMFPTVRRS